MRRRLGVLVVVLAACGRIDFDAVGDGGQTDSMVDAKPVQIIAIQSAGVWTVAASELRRTLATSVSNTTFTFSSWYKSTNAGTMLFCAGVSPSEQTFIWTDVNDATGEPYFQHVGSLSGPDYRPATTWPYLGQWVHLVISVDTTQAIADDRVRWWVNGTRMVTRVADMGVPFPLDQPLYLGTAILHTLGNKFDGGFPWTGELAETYVIWGHALDASEFVTVVGPDTVRSIVYTGPVEPESLYFSYPAANPGQNGFAAQPSWTATSMMTTATGLPY